MLTSPQKKEWKHKCHLLSKEERKVMGIVKNTQMWIINETINLTNWKKNLEPCMISGMNVG